MKSRWNYPDRVQISSIFELFGHIVALAHHNLDFLSVFFVPKNKNNTFEKEFQL